MAGNGLAAAEAELEKSKQRLASVRKHLVKPLNAKDKQNHFAWIVRVSLGEKEPEP